MRNTDPDALRGAEKGQGGGVAVVVDVLESPVCIPWTRSVCIVRFCCGFSLLRNYTAPREHVTVLVQDSV